MTENRSANYTRAFAAWELRLYLNNHPEDQAALKAYCALNTCDHYAALPEAYARGCWTWTEGPWPWEYEANAQCCAEEG